MQKVIAAVFLLLCAAVQAAEPVRLEGRLVQGGMVVGQAPPESTVKLNGSTLEQSRDGFFVFGLDRDAKSGDRLVVQLPDGGSWQKTLEIEAREYNIQHVTGVDDNLVSPEKPPEVWQRIREEVALVKAARDQHIEMQAFRQTFDWPIIGPITGVFGSQRVYNGRPGRPHYGVDVAAPVGAGVYAPADGKVTLAHPDMYYSGGTVIVDHGYGISSSFLHLSEVLVEVGDTVKQGDLIARVGAGGVSSGPHLDWRMNWYKRRIDPELLVPPMSALLDKTDERDHNDD